MFLELQIEHWCVDCQLLVVHRICVASLGLPLHSLVHHLANVVVCANIRLPNLVVKLMTLLVLLDSSSSCRIYLYAPLDFFEFYTFQDARALFDVLSFRYAYIAFSLSYTSYLVAFTLWCIITSIHYRFIIKV